MINGLANLFPSVFTQSDINTTLYYNAQAQKRRLQAAQEFYLKQQK